MMEAEANGDDPFDTLDSINLKDMKLFRSEREQYGEIIEDIRMIMEDYFDHWDGSDKEILPSRKNKRSAEHPFDIDLGNDIIFTGKIDEVGRSRGMRWLVENKSFNRLPNEDTRWKSVQSGVYIRAIEMMGWWNDIEGTLWNYVHSRAPDMPKILQSGKISEAKLNSLPSRVTAFLETQGAEPKEYPKLMSHVEANRDKYFLRVYTPLNDRVIQDTWEDFVATAVEIRDQGHISKQRNIDQHCSWCDYEKLCRAEITGMDVDFIKEREYTYDEKASDETQAPDIEEG